MLCERPAADNDDAQRAGARDAPHANAGHKREFKSHLYNRMVHVVLAIFFADGLRMQPRHA